MTPKDIAVIITAIGVPCLMFLAGGIYHLCNYIKSKRPHKSDDEEDNPIVKFKDDLAEIYEDNPNGKLKKLAQAVWNRVEEIEKWHKEEIHDWERKYYSAKWDVGELSVKCDGYREELDEWTHRCEELQSKLNESQERLKRESAKVKTLESETDKLRDMLKEKEQPDYLIEKRFPGQTDPFIKITMAEEALEQSIRMNTGAIIHIDSEDLNRYSVGRGPDGNLLKDEPTKNEEFIKQLRDWWGLEAQKAVELPNTDKEEEHRLTAEELRWKYLWTLLYSIPEGAPVKRFKVRVVGTYNNGRDMIHTDWELPATGINEIIDVLGKDGLRIIGGEELP